MDEVKEYFISYYSQYLDGRIIAQTGEKMRLVWRISLPPLTDDERDIFIRQHKLTYVEKSVIGKYRDNSYEIQMHMFIPNSAEEFLEHDVKINETSAQIKLIESGTRFWRTDDTDLLSEIMPFLTSAVKLVSLRNTFTSSKKPVAQPLSCLPAEQSASSEQDTKLVPAAEYYIIVYDNPDDVDTATAACSIGELTTIQFNAVEKRFRAICGGNYKNNVKFWKKTKLPEDKELQLQILIANRLKVTGARQRPLQTAVNTANEIRNLTGDNDKNVVFNPDAKEINNGWDLLCHLGSLGSPKVPADSPFCSVPLSSTEGKIIEPVFSGDGEYAEILPPEEPVDIKMVNPADIHAPIVAAIEKQTTEMKRSFENFRTYQEPVNESKGGRWVSQQKAAEIWGLELGSLQSYRQGKDKVKKVGDNRYEDFQKHLFRYKNPQKITDGIEYFIPNP